MTPFDSILSGLVAGFFLGVTSFYIFRKNQGLHETQVKRTKLVMVVRTDLNLKKGNTASLCSQAAVECYKKALKVCPLLVHSWECRGQPKVALKIDAEGVDGLLKIQEGAENLGIVTAVVKDHNFNPIVVGIGPASEEDIDNITGHLKLL